MIRFGTAAVVCAVAAFAAVVSYSHIYGLGRAHGQDGTAVRLLPLSVDGLILAASLVLLHEARNGRDAPGLARLMLWLGIGATIGANIAFGAGYGLLGALISAWPAVAFTGAVEIAMQQVRRSRAPRVATTAPTVPGDVVQAVRAAYAASVAAGRQLGQRAMATAGENLDGKYLLRCADPKMMPEDIAAGYEQLLEVERGWRDMKSVLDVRPVYHRLEERIPPTSSCAGSPCCSSASPRTTPGRPGPSCAASSAASASAPSPAPPAPAGSAPNWPGVRDLLAKLTIDRSRKICELIPAT